MGSSAIDATPYYFVVSGVVQRRQSCIISTYLHQVEDHHVCVYTETKLEALIQDDESAPIKSVKANALYAAALAANLISGFHARRRN